MKYSPHYLLQHAMIGTLMTTALLVPPDDRRTLLIANAHHYGSMIFIFCSAILFAILPDA